MNNANWQWGAAINLTSFKERTIYPISATATAAITGTWNVGAVSVCFLLSVSLFYSKIVGSAAMKLAAQAS